ncbi:MAG: GAF domain-containing protein [Candidatus Promineifilaceae bacterium]
MHSDHSNRLTPVQPGARFFEDFADRAGFIFWAARPDSFEIVYVNQFAVAALGLPLLAWQRPSFWQDHLYSEDREGVLALFATAVFTQKPTELEYRLRAADGSLRWFRDKVCLLSVEGQPLLCGMMTDVTSFKTAVARHVGLPGYTSAFLEIVQLLSHNIDIHERLAALAKRLTALFDVTAAYILDWNATWGIATQLATYSLEPDPDMFLADQSVHQMSNLIDGLSWQQQPRPVVLHRQTPNLPDWQQNHLAAHDAETILHIPILVANEVAGCIELIQRRQAQFFSPSDMELGQIIAQQTGIALARAQLFQAEARRRREAEILLDVAEFVSSSLDRNEILARVMEILRVYLGDVHNCVISLIDEDGIWLEPILSWWAEEAYALMPTGIRLKIDETFTANLALEGGDPVVISNLKSIPFVNEFTTSQVKQGLCAIVCVPLKIQNRPLGTLHIHHWHEARQFSSEEIAVLQGVANQTAIAIENARLFANERRQLQLSRTLQQVGSLLTASLPLSVVYDQIFELLSQVIAFDSASLFLFDKSAQQYVMAASRGFKKSLFEQIPRTLSAESVHNKLGHSPGWAVIDNVWEDQNWTRREPLDAIRSWVGALLRVKGETIGLLCVDGYRVNQYSLEDGRTVAAFANQAAVAIENAHLAMETLRQARELAILNQVSQETAVSLNIDQFLENVTNLVGHQLFPDMFGFILQDRETGDLQPHAAYRGLSLRAELIKIPAQNSITGHVFSTGEPYYAPDVLEDPHYFLIEEVVRSELAIPLRVENEVVGIIDAASPEKDHFSEQDLNFLSTLAGNISAVLERAKLYETLRVQAENLAQQVTQRTAELKVERDRLFAILESAGEGIILTDINAHIMYANPAMERQSGYSRKELLNQNPRILGSRQVARGVFADMWRNLGNQHSWSGELVNCHKDGHVYDVAVKITPISDAKGIVTGYVSVQSDITRLKELERLKTEFIANVSHQLRTPLTNIKTYVSLLEKGKAENYPRYFSVLHYEIDRLARLIQDLLDISRLDAEAAPHPDAAADFCGVWDLFWSPFVERAERENKTLAFNLPQAVRTMSPKIYMEGYQLEKLLSRLIENSFLYTLEESVIQVQVAWQESMPDFLQVQICDDGPGIPEAERPYIFDRFFRGALAVETGLPGNGLGLAIVRELLGQHGGQISLKSEVGAGSCFTVQLPLLRPKSVVEGSHAA